jgi:hypothetical protein
MRKYSLTKLILGSHWAQEGVVEHADGSISKGFEVEPLSSGMLEEAFEGGISDNFFAKLSDLLSKLPNLFDGHILLCRRSLLGSEVPGFKTKLYFFERTNKAESYSHLNAVLEELKFDSKPLSQSAWSELLSGIFGHDVLSSRLPDVTWERDFVRVKDRVVRFFCLSELTQLTW